MPSYPGNEVDPKYLLKYFSLNDSEVFKIKQSIMRFDTFYENVKGQPLSSFTRAMELKCRSLYPIFDELFNIDYVKYKEEIGLCAFIHNINNHEDDKDISEYGIERFRISIPSKANEPNARDIMAHELGHLYDSVEALEKSFNDVKKDLNYRIKNQEKLRRFLIDYLNNVNVNKANGFDDRANIIASFILNKRVIFCKHKAITVKELGRSYEDIVIALKNLKK
jgi:hypothetical protein